MVVAAAEVAVDEANAEIDAPGVARTTRIRRRCPKIATGCGRKGRRVDRRTDPAFVDQAKQLFDVGQMPTRLGLCISQCLFMGISGGCAGAVQSK